VRRDRVHVAGDCISGHGARKGHCDAWSHIRPEINRAQLRHWLERIDCGGITSCEMFQEIRQVNESVVSYIRECRPNLRKRISNVPGRVASFVELPQQGSD